MSDEIVIRECTTIDEYEKCIVIQRDTFHLPDIEVSPRRHFIVSRKAGGWTLGAFHNGELVGFVHHLAAVRGHDLISGYSHMMAVTGAFQNKGVGSMLKWAQRIRSLARGRNFIQWTWDPMQARNAHFNLNRLGVVVRAYEPNFYGRGYSANNPAAPGMAEIDTDRLIAEWELDSQRVGILADDGKVELGEVAAEVAIPSGWQELLLSDSGAASSELLRVRTEFQQALGKGLVCKAFDRRPEKLCYQFFSEADSVT